MKYALGFVSLILLTCGLVAVGWTAPPTHRSAPGPKTDYLGPPEHVINRRVSRRPVETRRELTEPRAMPARDVRPQARSTRQLTKRSEHLARRRDLRPALRDSQIHRRSDALQKQLAAIDRMRDKALQHGNLRLLERADALEHQARNRDWRLPPPPLPALHSSIPEPKVPPTWWNRPRADSSESAEFAFQPGLGKRTAELARIRNGQLPLPEQPLPTPSGPGYGRITAEQARAERGIRPQPLPDVPTPIPDPAAQPGSDPGVNLPEVPRLPEVPVPSDWPISALPPPEGE